MARMTIRIGAASRDNWRVLGLFSMMQGTIRPSARPIGLDGRSGARSVRPSRTGEDTVRSRQTELLILCARIGFNP
jgi:hypothetical protein